MVMNLDEIKEHWQRWALAGGTDISATTKTMTIKALEVAALQRAMTRAGVDVAGALDVCEIGCGNGHNLVLLSSSLPQARFFGVDYVEAMVTSARHLAANNGGGRRLSFDVGDALEIGAARPACYDVVFTDRMIINLNTAELQRRALQSIAACVKPGGLLLLVENFVEGHGATNDLRAALGLPRREPAPYNLFLKTDEVRRWAEDVGLSLSFIDDFGSLHDLLLYVIGPAVHGGNVDYADANVAAVTKLCLARPELAPSLGVVGQNRLLAFRKAS